MSETKFCKIEGCENKLGPAGKCWAHYFRMKRYGRIDLITRRPKLPHKIEVVDSETVIVNGFLFDTHWGEIFSYQPFHNDGAGYARVTRKDSDGRPYNEPIANIIAGNTRGSGFIVDHINGLKRDNTSKNLRILLPIENNLNRTHNPELVHFAKARNRWHAKAPNKDNKKRGKHIGYYKVREDAVEARRKYLIDNGFRILERP